jgi:hypothetical protein
VPKESHSINFNDKGVARFALGANHGAVRCETFSQKAYAANASAERRTTASTTT